MPYTAGLGQQQNYDPWAGFQTTTPPPAATTTGTQGNIAAMPDITSLANEINALNRAAQSAALANRIPQATALESKSSANISDELAGNVPSDVINLLGQQAAERGVARGLAGSQNTNAAYLRALGLTSLGQKAKGQQDLSAALARNAQAPLFDVTTQLITPYQQALLDFQKKQLQQQYDLEQQRMQLERSLGLMRGAGGGGGGGYGNRFAGPSIYGGDATAGAIFGGGDQGRYTGVPGRYPGYPMGFSNPTVYTPGTAPGASSYQDFLGGGSWDLSTGAFTPDTSLFSGGGGDIWSDPGFYGEG